MLENREEEESMKENIVQAIGVVVVLATIALTIAAIIQGFLDDLPPKIALDQARRTMNREVRPSQEHLEAMYWLEKVEKK